MTYSCVCAISMTPIYDIWLSEWVPGTSGAVHELRLRADGSMSRHAGSRGRTQRGMCEARVTWSTCQAQDGRRIRGEEGYLRCLIDFFVAQLLVLFVCSLGQQHCHLHRRNYTFLAEHQEWAAEISFYVAYMYNRFKTRIHIIWI